MSTPKRAWIFSDIHLGPEGPLAIFRDGKALGAAFRSIAEGEAAPTELILAGDVFDFLQSHAYAGFDAAQGPARLDAILSSPQSKAVVAGLTELVERPWCEVTVLSGNHDPEMLLPAVRERFEIAIGRRGTVHWADDDAPLLRGDERRPALTGRALADGAVWVAHGDRWDGANAIDRPAFARAVKEGAPVKLPAGSHLVFEVLAKVTPTRPWVSLLKPEVEAVLPLLLYLDPVTTAGFLRLHYGLSARLVASKIASAMNQRPHLGPADGAPAASPDDPLARAFGALGAALAAEPGRATIAAALADYLEDGTAPAPGEGTLASHGGLRRWLARAWLAHVRSSDEFLTVDGDDEVIDGARADLPADLPLFIAGHTHGPRRRPDLRYLNSGTWIPVGAIPPGELADLIDVLDAGTPWPSDSPRSCVRVELDGPAPRGVLMCASPDGALRDAD
ncbi:MAG: hypothetical protein U0325_00035 [Polyangiales bacterium]